MSEKWIYESPDNGVTVFRREEGDYSRELVMGEDYIIDDDGFFSMDNEKLQWEWETKSYVDEDGQLLRSIKEMAKSSPAVKESLEKLIMIYNLSKDDLPEGVLP